MGRKSTNKIRIKNTTKRSKFVRRLYPFFKTHGLMGFSMEEVSDALGVSKATIYNYFSSKEEIIDEFLREKQSDLAGFEKQMSNQNVPVTDRYEAALFNLLTHIADFSQRVRHDLEFIFPDKWRIFNSALDTYMHVVIGLYKEGQSKGVFNAVNPELMAICDRNMILFLSDQQNMNDKGFTSGRAFDEFMYMRKYGLVRELV